MKKSFKNPVFSIITVCLNVKEDVVETYNSIAEQDYSSFEWVVIDGNSTDGTKEFLLSIQDKIKFVSENDRGIYDAMNKGITLSCGEYLLFLNAGDTLYDNDVLKRVSSQLEGDIVIGWLNVKKHLNNKTSEYIRRVDNQDVRSKFLYHKSLPHQSSFIHRRLFDLYGMYDTSFKICGDYDFFTRVFLKKVNIKYLKFPIANFPMDGISAIMDKSDLHKDEVDKVRKKNFHLFYRLWRFIIDFLEKIPLKSSN